ncbi:hypothetical protein C3L33_08710, partial [Rhododendron williamsianum]
MATADEVSALELIRLHLLDEFSPFGNSLLSDLTDISTSDQSDSLSSQTSTNEPEAVSEARYATGEEVRGAGVRPAGETDFLGENIECGGGGGGEALQGSAAAAVGEEAAKAYDRAAFKMRGSKAILNFPLEAGKWREAPAANAAADGWRKRERGVEEEKAAKKEKVSSECNAYEISISSPMTPSSWTAVWDQNGKEVVSITCRCYRRCLLTQCWDFQKSWSYERRSRSGRGQSYEL